MSTAIAIATATATATAIATAIATATRECMVSPFVSESGGFFRSWYGGQLSLRQRLA